MNRLAPLLAGMLCLAGCAAEEPLSISCADFLALSSSDQLAVTAIWASPNRQEPDPAQIPDIPFYHSGLINFCRSDPGRPLERIAFDPGIGLVGV